MLFIVNDMQLFGFVGVVLFFINTFRDWCVTLPVFRERRKPNSSGTTAKMPK